MVVGGAAWATQQVPRQAWFTHKTLSQKEEEGDEEQEEEKENKV